MKIAHFRVVRGQRSAFMKIGSVSNKHVGLCPASLRLPWRTLSYPILAKGVPVLAPPPCVQVSGRQLQGGTHLISFSLIKPLCSSPALQPLPPWRIAAVLLVVATLGLPPLEDYRVTSAVSGFFHTPVNLFVPLADSLDPLPLKPPPDLHLPAPAPHRASPPTSPPSNKQSRARSLWVCALVQPLTHLVATDTAFTQALLTYRWCSGAA